MPSDTLTINRGQTARFKVKVSQDGNVLPPPASIPNSSSAPTIASLTRQPDESGRAVFTISGVNVGNATCSIGSGSGALSITVTINAAAPGPMLFERDGEFEVT